MMENLFARYQPQSVLQVQSPFWRLKGNFEDTGTD